MGNRTSINHILRNSTAPQHNMLKQNQANVNKWERTGLLEGLKTDYEKNAMSIILENQARQLVTEMTKTGTQVGSEEWNGVALPLVRRIFGEVVGKEFLSVQPMSLPSGLVFYLDFKYGTNQPGFTTGAGKESQEDSVFGVTETSDDPSGGLYGPGRFGYTTNDFLTSVLTVGASPAASNYATSSIDGDASNWNFNQEFYNEHSASIASGQIFKITVSSASLTNHDTVAVRAFTLSGSAITAVYPEFTKANADDSQISFIVKTSAAPVMSNVNVKYFKQPTSTTRGDFEDTTGDMTDIGIPEINLEMRSKEIVAKTRKLKTIWTPEMAQDLNAYHAIDAEMELTNMLSEYISQEIDLEIFEMLIGKAQTIDYWSAKIGRRYDPLTNSMTNVQSDEARASSYTQQTWFQTLGTKIQRVSNLIHQKTMRGGANIMAVSPKVATILESIEGYRADTNGDQSTFAFGAGRVGTFHNKIQVYKVPYMQENTILLAYRGNQFFETGAVYAPYVPLIMTPVIHDPVNFTPRKGVMTRYAKEMIRNEFYGKIHIGDLDVV